MNVSQKYLKNFSRLLFSGLVSFFVVGFLKNFYPSIWQFILLTVLLNVFCALAFELIVEHAILSLKDSWREKIILLLTLGLGFVFILLTARLLIQYPKIYSPEFFLPGSNFISWFLGVTVLSQAGAVFLLPKLEQRGWRSSPIMEWIKRNLPGLLFAIAVTIATFALSTGFTYPGFTNADNYFDTDSADWINRLTADVDELMVMRPVHPFAFLIFRPPTWLLSIFLNGNKFYAALLLNSMLGGICVLLTWLFFKERTKNSTFALLIAALLGLSNSHLTLSVFLESYMFSATALILFLLLLQRNEKKLAYLVLVGLLSFGITITNFAQTCVLLFMSHPRLKTIFKYILSVLILALLLAFVQDVLYPSSDPFYIPNSYSVERHYRFDVFEAETQSVINRANVFARSISLFSVVAPRPLILQEEIGCAFPCSMVYYYTSRGEYFISSYDGFGNIVVYSWFLLMLVAGGWFVLKFFKSPQSSALPVALLVNILFNFILHLNYGDDPMLYSPDWTYAVVFFLGICYEDIADKKWFHAILVVFLTGLAINNLDLFRRIMDAVSPFFK
jgi:hypothetical protein